MKVVALVSGGKDSCYNMMQCVSQGHEIVALANLAPPAGAPDEMDSFMYQTVGHDAVRHYGACMQLPLFREAIMGRAIDSRLVYSETEHDETEDLFRLLQRVKTECPEVEGVSVGAILSNYQRTRVENVCTRLGLTSLAFLWQREQHELLDEMVAAGVDAVIIKVAGIGLTAQHLGRPLAQMRDHLFRMHDKFGLHPCGEGGEYETFVLDCPLFKQSLAIDHAEVVTQDSEVAHLAFTTRLVDKPATTPKGDWLKLVPRSPLLENNMLNLSRRLRQVDKGEAFRIAEQTVRTRAPENNEYEGKIDLSLSSRFSAGPLHIVQRKVYGEVSDLVSRSEAALASINSELASMRMSMKNCVFVTVLLRDMALFGPFNTVYGKAFGFELPSTRACYQASFPEGSEQLLEIQCLVSETLTDESAQPRQGLHVQSRSFWAPANIGPYSQALDAWSHTFVSGQIGMEPSTLALPDDLATEICLSLQNVGRILQARGSGQRIYAAVAFITSKHLAPIVSTAWIHFMGYRGDPLEELLIAEVEGLPKGANVEWQVIASDSDGHLGRRATFSSQLRDSDALKAMLESISGKHGVVLGFTTRPDMFDTTTNVAWVPVKSLWNGLLQAQQFGQIYLTEPASGGVRSIDTT